MMDRLRHFSRLLALVLVPLLVIASVASAGAPSATTTVVTRGIQGPPGPPALSTTLSFIATMPTVGSTTTAIVASSSGTAVGQYVTISGLGTLYVTAVGGNTLTLQNTGATGNASAGSQAAQGASVVASGPPGPGGAAGPTGSAGATGATGATGPNGHDSFTSTTASFTQPPSGASVIVNVGYGSWAVMGQTVFVTVGGYYTVTASSANNITLQNNGVSGNASSGSTIGNGSTIAPAGVIGPTGATGATGAPGTSGFTAGGDLTGSSTSQQVSQLTSSSVIPVTTALSFGSGAAQSGQVRLGSTGVVMGRNTANTADLHLIQADGANNAIVGDWSVVAAVGLRGVNEVDVGAGGSINQMRFYPAYAVLSVPIISDTSNTSPYSIHGDASGALTASRGITTTELSKTLIAITPSASGFTLSGFPLEGSGGGYPKDILNLAAFSFTISDGTHTATIPATVGLYRAWFTSMGIYVK